MEIVKKFLSGISPDRRRRAIVALGLIGLTLIFISSFIPHERGETETAAQPPPEAVSEDDYRKTLEQELIEMISSIDGAGSVKVMITMDSTAEDIFAVDKNESESLSSSQEGETRRSAENEYVIVKGKDGGEQAVLKKQRMPEIRGVLVVCSGGASSVTREKVTQAVAGALGVERSKVVVTN